MTMELVYGRSVEDLLLQHGIVSEALLVCKVTNPNVWTCGRESIVIYFGWKISKMLSWANK